jgi:hypothetical protein
VLLAPRGKALPVAMVLLHLITTVVVVVVQAQLAQMPEAVQEMVVLESLAT